jgi:hypothetical protein
LIATISPSLFAFRTGKWFAAAHQPAPITPTRAFRVIFALAAASIRDLARACIARSAAAPTPSRHGETQIHANF